MTPDEVIKRIILTNIRTENIFCDTDAYSYAHDALMEMREDGYDVKMDMQSYKLSLHGFLRR